MLNIILGILIGAAATVLVQKARTTLDIKWFAWLLFILAAIAVVFAFDVLTGSFLEHEYRAAWMGFGSSIFLATTMIVAGWRWGVTKRA
jgi:hypothetical protein